MVQRSELLKCQFRDTWDNFVLRPPGLASSDNGGKPDSRYLFGEAPVADEGVGSPFPALGSDSVTTPKITFTIHPPLANGQRTGKKTKNLGGGPRLREPGGRCAKLAKMLKKTPIMRQKKNAMWQSCQTNDCRTWNFTNRESCHAENNEGSNEVCKYLEQSKKRHGAFILCGRCRSYGIWLIPMDSSEFC